MFVPAGYEAWPHGKQAAGREKLSDDRQMDGERKKLFQRVVYREMCQNFCDKGQSI